LLSVKRSVINGFGCSPQCVAKPQKTLKSKKIIISTSHLPFPRVHLIASPVKIIQGHNVFGSDNIELGWLMMLKLLSDKKPHIFDMLDFLVV
jgi:II/X family phage/plasmid replication protein